MSFLKSLGMKMPPVSTPVPQLSVDGRYAGLSLESKKYFNIAANATAQSNKLAVTVEKNQNFSSESHVHNDFLKRCTELFREKSSQLKSVDQKILGSVVFGVTATALSFLPFVGFLGYLGWGAAVYYIHQRAVAYVEYQEALTLLVGVCNWSLGEGAGVHQLDQNIADITDNESIRNMMTMLYPVLTKDQIKHLIANEIEGGFTQELESYEGRFSLGLFTHSQFFPKNKDERIALSKKGAEFNRYIYGFNNGKFTDFLEAIMSIIPDLYRATVYGMQRLKCWWEEKNATSEESHVQHSIV